MRARCVPTDRSRRPSSRSASVRIDVRIESCEDTSDRLDDSKAVNALSAFVRHTASDDCTSPMALFSAASCWIRIASNALASSRRFDCVCSASGRTCRSCERCVSVSRRLRLTAMPCSSRPRRVVSSDSISTSRVLNRSVGAPGVTSGIRTVAGGCSGIDGPVEGMGIGAGRQSGTGSGLRSRRRVAASSATAAPRAAPTSARRVASRILSAARPSSRPRRTSSASRTGSRPASRPPSPRSGLRSVTDVASFAASSFMEASPGLPGPPMIPTPIRPPTTLNRSPDRHLTVPPDARTVPVHTHPCHPIHPYSAIVSHPAAYSLQRATPARTRTGRRKIANHPSQCPPGTSPRHGAGYRA